MLRVVGVCGRVRHPRRSIGRVMLIGGCAALAACRSAAPITTTVRREEPPAMCADTSATSRVPSQQRDALPPRDPNRTPDYFFTMLSTELPGGFGGVYVEPVPVPARQRRRGAPEQQRTVIRLQDTTLAPDALEALKARLRAYYGPMLSLANVRLQPSRWSFAQLEEWWRYLTPRLFFRSAVHMADVDERRNRVAVEVATDSALHSTRAILDTLGVPCGLIEIRVGPMAQLTDHAAVPPANPR